MKRISHLYFLLLNVGVSSYFVNASHELDSCPGYNAENVQVTEFALTADLVLAGEPCAVYGEELQKLSLLVEYQTGE
jgi:alpha-glucosidase